MFNVVIYKNKGCMKCRFTIRKFKSAGINPKVNYFDDEALSYAKQKGYGSAPLVQIYNKDNTLIDEWSDLNISKINKYIAKFKNKK